MLSNESSNTTSNKNNETSVSIFDKYKGSGLTGLANVGNTCYLNSCINSLIRMK